MNYSDLTRFQQYADDLRGVFPTADLANCIGERTPLRLARALDTLCRNGALHRAQRGIYVTPNYDLAMLAARIFPRGYISCDSALAHHGLIGSIPEYRVAIVGTGRSRRINIAEKSIQYLALQSRLCFGFARLQSGVPMADPEKAWLDLLYFYVKGHRFVIDPRREIDVRRLRRARIAQYLTHYANPKFVRFVKGIFRDA